MHPLSHLAYRSHPGRTLLLAIPLTLAGAALAADAPDERVYDGGALEPEQKCTSIDYRTFHLCPEMRFFDPAARIYFDTGSDDPSEVDVFRDGNLTATIDMATLYFPWRMGRSPYYDDWTWGPMLSVGISSAADDSADGTNSASSAPVVLASVGLLVERRFGGDNSFGFELGVATGFSSDEALSDITDTAVFVGLRLDISMGGADERPPPPDDSP